MNDNVPKEEVGSITPVEKPGVMTNILHRIAEQLEAIREVQSDAEKERTEQRVTMDKHAAQIQLLDEFKSIMQVTVSKLLLGLPAALILAILALIVAIASLTSVMTFRSDMRHFVESSTTQ